MSSAVLGRGWNTMLMKDQINDLDMQVLADIEEGIEEEVLAGIRRLTHEAELYEWYSRNPYKGKKIRGFHDYDRK